MKDLIFVFIFLYSLNLVFKQDSILAMYIIAFILIIYLIKFHRLNLKITNLKRNFHFELNNTLNKQKDIFADILTHDLKIPTLAQLRGLELIRNETLGTINEEQKDLIENIESSCKYILNMISMLQNTYKIETGKNKFNYEKFNISKLLVNCINKMSKDINEKNISIVYFSSEPDIYVEADQESIKEVIINLLLFAISYSYNNDKILVYISKDENNVKFLLKTSGVYLSNQVCSNIFEQENIDSQNYTVIGQKISLYLCKKIIEEHAGDIYAKSSQDNSLSLIFKLPYFKKNSLNSKVSAIFYPDCKEM